MQEKIFINSRPSILKPVFLTLTKVPFSNRQLVIQNIMKVFLSYSKLNDLLMEILSFELDSIGTNTVLICSNILDALKITSEVANSFKANLGDALVKKVILKDLLCDAILAYPYTQQVRVYVSNKALALNKSFDHGLEKYRAELNKKLDFITKLLVQLDIKESKKCLNFASTENLDI
ncbi:hypothetical protein ROZALSC1DRAFT_25604, partial [Rozella allomycis CSF55]